MARPKIVLRALTGRLQNSAYQLRAFGATLTQWYQPPINNTAYSAVILANNPIAYYRMNEASGTVAYDASGHSHHARLSGVTSHSQTGAVGDGDASTLFTGPGSIILPPSLHIELMPTFGLEFWIQVEGVWEYVGVDWDGTTMTVYRNGTPYTPGAGASVGIEQSFAWAGSAMVGKLDGIALYPRLTSTMAAADYAAGNTSTTTFVPRAFAAVLIETGINVALAETLTGVGQFSPAAAQLSTALALTFAGSGAVTPALSASLSLAVTLAGTSTDTAASPTLSTSLSSTLAGGGTLAGTISTTAPVALSVTLAGTSTGAATLSLRAPLVVSLAGTGVLSGAVSVPVTFSLTAAGTGALSGLLTVTASVGTVSTSSVAFATQQTSGQLAFVASDGTACVLWCDGTNQKFSYASLPYTSWTTVTLTTGLNMALGGRFQAGGDNINVVTGGTSSVVPTYKLLTKVSVTWTLGSGTQISATAAGTASVGNVMVYAGQDPQGRHWIVCGAASTYLASRALFSPANNPAGTWTSNLSTTQTSDVNLPAGDQVGNYLLKTYWNGTAMQYHRLDTSVVTLGAWSTAATIPNLTGSPGATSRVVFRAVSATQGLLVYSTGSGIYAQTYTPGTDTWSAATQLSTNASDRHPTITIDGLGHAWVFWCSFVGTNSYALVYKKWSGAAWDGSATTLVAAGTNIANPNAGYGNGIIGITVTVGTANPFTVGWVTLTVARALSCTFTGTGRVVPILLHGYAALVVADGAQAYYRVNEAAGTSVADATGHGYTAQLSGSVTYTQTGAIIGDSDTAILFNTGAAQLAVPSTLNISTWTALSLEFWEKQTEGWQQIVVTTDATSTILYQNGAVYTPTTGDPVLIDQGMAYAGSYNAGTLDEVSISNTVLTPTQILTHFQAGSGIVLAVQLAGVGTVAGPLTLKTALVATATGTGTLTPQLLATLSLPTCQIFGTGTLVGTLLAALPLPGTSLVGVATLVGPLSATTTLATVTLAGTSVLSGAATLSTALAGQLDGVGVLTGTLQTVSGIALTGQFDGIGALSATAQFSTALSLSASGIGQLSGSLDATFTLSGVTLIGTGTLNGTGQFSTILAITTAGTGVMMGGLSAALPLPSVTMGGAGSLVGTIQLTTALSSTLAGTGTLVGTVQAACSLAGVQLPGASQLTGAMETAASLVVTLAGTGQLAGTAQASALFTNTLPGTGQLAGTLSGGGVLASTLMGSGTLAGSLSASLTLDGTPFIGTATLTPSLTAAFALPGVMLVGIGQFSSGTAQLATVLASSETGSGTLSGLLSADVLLASVIMPGSSQLSGTVAMGTQLVGTLSGVGGVTAPLLASWHIPTTTCAGIGTFTGTDNLTTQLLMTLVGAGTFTGAAPSFKTALSSTFTGSSQLVGGISGGGALALTLVGTSQLAGTVNFVTSLLVILPGSSGLAGSMTSMTMLTVVYTGIGTFSPLFVIGGNFACTLSGHGIVLVMAFSFPGKSATATWRTRDLKTAWKTRDLKATWETRDLEETWKGRR